MGTLKRDTRCALMIATREAFKPLFSLLLVRIWDLTDGNTKDLHAVDRDRLVNLRAQDHGEFDAWLHTDTADALGSSLLDVMTDEGLLKRVNDSGPRRWRIAPKGVADMRASLMFKMLKEEL